MPGCFLLPAALGSITASNSAKQSISCQCHWLSRGWCESERASWAHIASAKQMHLVDKSLMRQVEDRMHKLYPRQAGSKFFFEDPLLPTLESPTRELIHGILFYCRTSLRRGASHPSLFSKSMAFFAVLPDFTAQGRTTSRI